MCSIPSVACRERLSQERISERDDKEGVVVSVPQMSKDTVEESGLSFESAATHSSWNGLSLSLCRRK